MKKLPLLLLVMLLIINLISSSCVESTPNTKDVTPMPALDSEPEPELPPEPEFQPEIVIPAGMSAFYGEVVWGEKPQVYATVIADTKPPAVVIPPWESHSTKYKSFTTDTGDEGVYVLIVEPGKYYIGCSLLDSEYITYETWGRFGLLGTPTHEIGIGETVRVDLEANDWTVRLISPGSQIIEFNEDRFGNTLKTDTPILAWQQYNWARYDGETGYYEVELGILKDGYQMVFKKETGETSYSVESPLKSGDYTWVVKVYSSSGKKISGTIDALYFIVP